MNKNSFGCGPENVTTVIINSIEHFNCYKINSSGGGCVFNTLLDVGVLKEWEGFFEIERKEIELFTTKNGYGFNGYEITI